MRQTFFFIPYEIFGLPVFGFGILFVLWFLGLCAVCFFYWKSMEKKSGIELVQTFFLALLVGGVICWGLPKAGCAAGIPVRAYGTMMLLGILLAFGLAVWRAPRFGFKGENVSEILFCLCIPGILGARAFYVIEYWESFRAPTIGETFMRIADIPGGGLVVYGAFIGALIGAIAYLLIKRLSIRRMMDLLAPSLLLGLALGRIGCFLNGCCFGGICDPAHESWGVHFPAGSPPFTRQLEEGKLKIDPDAVYYGLRLAGDPLPTAPAPTFIAEVLPGSIAEKAGLTPGDYILKMNGRETLSRNQVIESLIWTTHYEGKATFEISREEGTFTLSWTTTDHAGPVSLPVYPTQLYSSVNAFCLCAILLFWSWFRRNPNGVGMKLDGEVFVLFLTLYPVSRFILEMIRTDENEAFGTGLSISQNVSILLFLVAAGLWILLLTKGKGTNAKRLPPVE